jgi:hypothetical protein
VVSRIHCAAFSAIISVGELVLPLVMVGMAPASTTRRPRRRARTAVEHGHGVVARPIGGAHGVEDGGGNVARQARQVLVALVLHAGLELLGLVRASAGWATMRVTRRLSAATWRSSGVLR